MGILDCISYKRKATMRRRNPRPKKGRKKLPENEKKVQLRFGVLPHQVEPIKKLIKDYINKQQTTNNKGQTK